MSAFELASLRYGSLNRLVQVWVRRSGVLLERHLKTVEVALELGNEKRLEEFWGAWVEKS